MKNLKCEFCGKTLEEAKACHVNGHVLCSPCMLTDSRTLDLEWPKKGISIDNGLTFIEPEEAIKQKEWAVIAHLEALTGKQSDEIVKITKTLWGYEH